MMTFEELADLGNVIKEAKAFDEEFDNMTEEEKYLCIGMTKEEYEKWIKKILDKIEAIKNEQ